MRSFSRNQAAYFKHSAKLLYACVLFPILSASAYAQECETSAFTGQQDFKAVITCLNRQLSKTQTRVKELENKLTLAPFPKGAVVAFDRNRTTDRVCPKGWTIFDPAGGRFIVGAGIHQNTDRTKPKAIKLDVYPSYSEDSEKAIGGQKRVSLSLEELPPHDHHNGDYKYLMKIDKNNTHHNSINANRNEPNLLSAKASESVGGGKSHNNLPPYVALYFCKKD